MRPGRRFRTGASPARNSANTTRRRRTSNGGSTTSGGRYRAEGGPDRTAHRSTESTGGREGSRRLSRSGLRSSFPIRSAGTTATMAAARRRRARVGIAAGSRRSASTGSATITAGPPGAASARGRPTARPSGLRRCSTRREGGSGRARTRRRDGRLRPRTHRQGYLSYKSYCPSYGRGAPNGIGVVIYSRSTSWVRPFSSWP